MFDEFPRKVLKKIKPLYVRILLTIILISLLSNLTLLNLNLEKDDIIQSQNYDLERMEKEIFNLRNEIYSKEFTEREKDREIRLLNLERESLKNEVLRLKDVTFLEFLHLNSMPSFAKSKIYFVRRVQVEDREYLAVVDYSYYESLKKDKILIFNENSLQRVFLPKSDELRYIVSQFERDFEDPYEMANAMLGFVQNLGYRVDEYNKNRIANNLTQYAPVTLVDSGDCLNLSILLFNLYWIAGYDTILVQFHDHVMVGVNVEGEGASIILDSKRYLLADPAQDFLQLNLGEIPKNYLKKSIVKIYTVECSEGMGCEVSSFSSYEWG